MLRRLAPGKKKIFQWAQSMKEPLPFESLSKLSKPLFLQAESQQGKLQLQKNLSEKVVRSWKKAGAGQKAANSQPLLQPLQPRFWVGMRLFPAAQYFPELPARSDAGFLPCKCSAVEMGMFCPRPFVDEGCQVPAAPATEPSAVPGQIFSGEKQLSHSTLGSVPTSPAARDAQEFTEDRRSHGEPAGFGLLICKPLRAGRKHLPGLGSVGSVTARKSWRDCGREGSRPAFQPGRAASGCACSTGGKCHWEARGRGEGGVSGPNAGSRPGSGAGAGPGWLQAGKGQSHGSSPRR